MAQKDPRKNIPSSGREGNHALGERRMIGVAPPEGPVGLLPDTGDRLNCAQQVHLGGPQEKKPLDQFGVSQFT